MNQDTTDFLATLLWDADMEGETGENRPLCGKSVFDFSDAFVAAAERFLVAFRAHLAAAGFDMSKLDAPKAERSFGGNVYFSLSGAGAGFFDACDPDVSAIHDTLEEWAGALRFHELSSNLDVGADDKIDLAYIPEALDRMRDEVFAIQESQEEPFRFDAKKSIDGEGPDNGKRASVAEAAVSASLAARGDPPQIDEDAVKDLVVDLGHLSDKMGFDFEQCLGWAKLRWREER